MNSSPGARRSPLGLLPGHRGPRLYDRMVEILRLRHHSIRTEQTYRHWVRRFIHFHDAGVVCADSTTCCKGQKPGFRILCGSI